MAFVVSSGQLASTRAPLLPSFASEVQLSDGVYADYATIWRTQSSVRTVVSFLARNIGSIGLHFYRRVSDTDRQRLTDHPGAALFARPNPALKLTQYRLLNGLVHDVGIYDDAFWLKARGDDGRLLAFVPIPPVRVRPTGGNWLAPDSYKILVGTSTWKTFPADQVVHFHGYNPTDPRVGDSPMNSLRALLLEEYEAIRQRQQMWRNGARLAGVIERPKDAPAWGSPERARFRAGWRSSYTGAGGDAGGTPLLEDGMTYKQIGIDPKSAQYIESRKLTREEAAAAYFIPPPLVGILEHATFSNIREQHQHLYQDTLGPWLASIEQDIAEQVIPDLPDNSDVYAEFNIASKMRGSFEEQAAAASTATGGPWMTRNEIRARNNLPAIDGGDELIVPLNVTEGGLASPRDTDPTKSRPRPILATAVRLKNRPAELDAGPAEASALHKALAAHLAAQAAEVLAGLGVKALPVLDDAWGDPDARDAALAEVLVKHAGRIAETAAWDVLDEHNPTSEGWAAAKMQPWLATASATYAAAINRGTRGLLLTALADPGTWEQRVAGILSDRTTYVDLWSRRITTECASFGGQDAAKASGLTEKTWHAGDDLHTDLDGVTVDLAAEFPNGGRWPGDFRAGREQVEGCACSLSFS